MTEVSYGYTKNLGKIDFDQALGNVAEALKVEGFGVLMEIDVKGIFEKKLNIGFRKYRILGACNPSLAHRAITKELLIGLLLPCNVVVFEEDDGTVSVSMIKPSEMFKVVDNNELASITGEVDAKLRRALDSVN